MYCTVYPATCSLTATLLRKNPQRRARDCLIQGQPCSCHEVTYYGVTRDKSRCYPFAHGAEMGLFPSSDFKQTASIGKARDPSLTRHNNNCYPIQTNVYADGKCDQPVRRTCLRLFLGHSSKLESIGVSIGLLTASALDTLKLGCLHLVTQE